MSAPPGIQWAYYFAFLFSVSIEVWQQGPDDAILAGDQLSIGDRMNVPVLDLGIGGAEPHHFVLDEEGHHLRQFHLVFLADW